MPSPRRGAGLSAPDWDIPSAVPSDDSREALPGDMAVHSPATRSGRETPPLARSGLIFRSRPWECLEGASLPDSLGSPGGPAPEPDAPCVGISPTYNRQRCGGCFCGLQDVFAAPGCFLRPQGVFLRLPGCFFAAPPRLPPAPLALFSSVLQDVRNLAFSSGLILTTRVASQRGGS